CVGPLAVAVAGARRPAGLAWAGLAAAGVLLLTQGSRGHLDVAGVVFALVSAAGWAGYILLSRATGQRFSGTSGLVIAMCVAAVLVTGPGLAAGAPQMFRPSLLLIGVAIGVMSSVVPYWLGFEALRRGRRRGGGGVDEHAAGGGGADRSAHARAAAEPGRMGRGLLRGGGQRRCRSRGGARGGGRRRPGVTMGPVSSWLARVMAPILRPT